MASQGRALITGIRGFTGVYLASELERAGYEVCGLGLGAGDEPGYFRADLDKPEELKSVMDVVRPDVVIHLAALAFVGHGNADDFYRVNLVGTRHLLEAIAQAPEQPRCVLLASSANVYGNASTGVLDEEVQPSPANDYAVSKLAMEHMAALWRDKLPLVITRPFNYTGVGQGKEFLLPKIVEHFRNRADVIELGNLDVSRDFSDVRTVAHVYRRLLEHPDAIGGTYNVCSGQAVSLQTIIAMCSEITGHDLQVRVNPAFVRSNEVKQLRGDNARLHTLLGDWETRSLRQTLQWMLDS